jgi:hypothetical protein
VLAQSVDAQDQDLSKPREVLTESIAQGILGQWEGIDPSLQLKIYLTFTSVGTMSIRMETVQDKKSIPFPLLKYQLNSTVKPAQLDITIPSNPQPVLTIVDLTDDGQLKIQLAETDPGKPRPTDFSEKATLFKKIPALPEQVQPK